MRSQITFRLVGETSNTYTEAKARTLAGQIRTVLPQERLIAGIVAEFTVNTMTGTMAMI